MNTRNHILAGIVGLFVAAFASAQSNEDATLNATINGGALEIVPASVNGPWTPVGGAVTVTDSLQADALVFNIDGITINDLNGDGLGWQLTATPAANLSDGSNNLPLGTNDGFNNPSDVGGVIDNANQVTYASGAGISGFTIDYDVAYDVPAFAVAGSYTGVVAFTLVAQ